ncbi:hypothetical protein [Paenibacillus alginolyticus]|uniref:Uncharacterized protein n=1 Tax=Paenibacillus alginolyticus TaxID=59839 RepID=A0ABT4GG25_9BACL|nr:hypothetical protein [Paenibacillus alginolyticus]MCY9695132.1 hypothetical protein [Paenibacillus alginolyticus]
MNFGFLGNHKGSQFSELHREVTLSVEAVLKGEITQKEIILKRDRRKDLLHPGEVSYDFPKGGTKVMLFLRNYTNGLSLTGDFIGVRVHD